MAIFPRVVIAWCLVALFAPRSNAQTKVVALDADLETTYMFPNGQEITSRGHFYRSSSGQVREESGLGAIITDVDKGTVTLLVSDAKEARIVAIPTDRRASARRKLPIIEGVEEGTLEGHPIAKAHATGPNGERQEIWTAKDLGIVVWTRVESKGLTMTRSLSRVGVAEPKESLFQIPSDYIVIDQPLSLEATTNTAGWINRAATENGLGQVVVLPDPVTPKQ